MMAQLWLGHEFYPAVSCARTGNSRATIGDVGSGQAFSFSLSLTLALSLFFALSTPSPSLSCTPWSDYLCSPRPSLAKCSVSPWTHEHSKDGHHGLRPLKLWAQTNLFCFEVVSIRHSVTLVKSTHVHTHIHNLTKHRHLVRFLQLRPWPPQYNWETIICQMVNIINLPQ